MERVAGTPEFEQENLQVSYPFVVNVIAEGQADGAHGNVVDFTMSTSTYAWNAVYSLSVQRVGGVTELTVYRGSSPVVTPADQVGTDVVGDWAITEFRVEDGDGRATYIGCIVTRAEDFLAGTGVLLPGRVFSLGEGVASLSVDGEEEVLRGDVLLSVEDNMRAEVEGQEVVLVGEERVACSIPAPAPYLQTINGVGPSSSGAFHLSPGLQGCISVQPHPPSSEVILRSDCSSPSPRKGRAAAYERLLHAAVIYGEIGKALTSVKLYAEGVHEQIENFIDTRVEEP